MRPGEGKKMASLSGESVTLNVTFSNSSDNGPFNATLLTTTFLVEAGVEVVNQPVSATFQGGGFPQTLNGTITVDVTSLGFVVSFVGTAQPGELKYTFSSLSDESASAVLSASQTASSGTIVGVNQTLSPTHTTDTVSGGFFLLGFQPGTSVSQSVQLTLADSLPNTAPTATHLTQVKGYLEDAAS